MAILHHDQKGVKLLHIPSYQTAKQADVQLGKECVSYKRYIHNKMIKYI